MDNPDNRPASGAGPSDMFSDDRKFVAITYLLYLAGFVIPLTPIAGIIIAHTTGGPNENEVVTSHRTFAIRTFWLAFLASIVGAILMLVFIGWFVLIAVAAWTLVRSVMGLLALKENKPIADPKGFLW